MAINSMGRKIQGPEKGLAATLLPRNASVISEKRLFVD